MKRVIVFRKALLPYSETFIKNQALAMRRWNPTLIGERFVKGGLPMHGLDVSLICPGMGNIYDRFCYKFCLLLQKPYSTGLCQLKELNASLVHAHFGPFAVDIWPLARELGVPLLVTLHGYDINIYREWWEAGKGGWRRRRYPAQLLKLAQESRVHFIAVSAAIRDRAIEYGIPPEKITIRYVGVHTEKFKSDSMPLEQRPQRVLFVGRLVEKKGVSYLIRAFAEVQRKIAAAELVVVGDGPLRDELKGLAKSLEVPVAFKNVLSEAEVREQMTQVRALCLPSITSVNGDAEGFGMVLLEAQASGVPVVSSARGGSTEGLLDGKTGFRCREKDVECLAKSMEKLLLNDSLWQSFSLNAVRFVRENFDLRDCTEKLEDLYDQQVKLHFSGSAPVSDGNEGQHR